jgi:hypothetical protein
MAKKRASLSSPFQSVPKPADRSQPPERPDLDAAGRAANVFFLAMQLPSIRREAPPRGPISLAGVLADLYEAKLLVEALPRGDLQALGDAVEELTATRQTVFSSGELTAPSAAHVFFQAACGFERLLFTLPLADVWVRVDEAIPPELRASDDGWMNPSALAAVEAVVRDVCQESQNPNRQPHPLESREEWQGPLGRMRADEQLHAVILHLDENRLGRRVRGIFRGWSLKRLRDEWTLELTRACQARRFPLASPDEASPGKAVTDPPAATTAEANRETKAIAYLARHPEATQEEVASAVGVSRTTLYRWKKYREARERLLEQEQQWTPLSGHRSKDGGIEAYDKNQ